MAEYQDPIDALEDKVNRIVDHFADHCDNLNEIFYKLEKLEKRNSYLISGIVFAIVISLVSLIAASFVIGNYSGMGDRVDRIEAKKLND